MNPPTTRSANMAHTVSSTGATAGVQNEVMYFFFSILHSSPNPLLLCYSLLYNPLPNYHSNIKYCTCTVQYYTSLTHPTPLHSSPQSTSSKPKNHHKFSSSSSCSNTGEHKTYSTDRYMVDTTTTNPAYTYHKYKESKHAHIKNAEKQLDYFNTQFNKK